MPITLMFHAMMLITNNGIDNDGGHSNNGTNRSLFMAKIIPF